MLSSLSSATSVRAAEAPIQAARGKITAHVRGQTEEAAANIRSDALVQLRSEALQIEAEAVQQREQAGQLHRKG